MWTISFISVFFSTLTSVMFPTTEKKAVEMNTKEDIRLEIEKSLKENSWIFR